jgi:hypothetical protein
MLDVGQPRQHLGQQRPYLRLRQWQALPPQLLLKIRSVDEVHDDVVGVGAVVVEDAVVMIGNHVRAVDLLQGSTLAVEALQIHFVADRFGLEDLEGVHLPALPGPPSLAKRPGSYRRDQFVTLDVGRHTYPDGGNTAAADADRLSWAGMLPRERSAARRAAPPSPPAARRGACRRPAQGRLQHGAATRTHVP